MLGKSMHVLPTSFPPLFSFFVSLLSFLFFGSAKTDLFCSQVAMAWRKPQPLKPVTTSVPKQATLAPKFSNFKPTTLAPKITSSPSKVLITPKLSSPSPAKSNHPIATTSKPTNTNISKTKISNTNISKTNSLASHLSSHSTKPSLPPTSQKFTTKPSLSQKLSSSLPSSKSHMQNPHPKFSPTRI